MEGSTVYNTVFIDTNLDTHLALIVSDVDTVANLKKKIMYEHPLCFPNFGEIKIHALKVKRKGYFYHLTDHMFVKSAFDGSKKNWFLSIDAASVINNDKSKLSSDPGSSNALLCVTNGPLADGVDLLPDGTSKKLSFMDGSKLHQFDGDHLLNQEVPIAEHFGPDTSIRGVLKDLEMEVKHVSGNHCKTSSSDSSQKFDSGLQEKCYSKGNEMLGRPTNCKKDNSQNEIRDLQFNFPLVENLQDGAVSKKKVKSKRKFESLVDSCALKVNDGSIDASCKDILEQEITVPHNACKGFHNDTGLENKHIRDEPSKDLSSDWEKTQVIGMSAENNDGILKEKVVNVQPRVSMGEASEVVTAAKKKRKIEKKGKAPLNENEALICISSKETYKSENIITKDDKETTTVPYVSLSTGLPKDDSMIVNNTKSEKKTTKKKKKPSSSKKDVAVTVPFSMEDVGEERSKETLGMSQKESDEAVDHVQTVQDAMCAEPCSISFTKVDKQETTTVPYDSLSTELPKDDNMIVSNSKSGKKTMKKKKKPSSSNKDKGATVPFSMEDIREEHSKETLGMSQKDSDKKFDEAVDHVQTIQDAMHAEPCSISSRNKLSVTVPEVGAVREVFTHDIDPSEVDAEKTRNEMQSSQNNDPKVMLPEKSKPSDQGEKGMGMNEVVISSELLVEALEVHENVVESVHPMPASKSEEIPDTWDVKGRKKSGKKRGSTVENLPDVHMKEQYVGHSSIDKTKETDVPSKKKKKSTLVETGSEIPINESNLQSQKDTVNKLESLQCQAGVDVDSTSSPADESIKKIGDSRSQGDRIEFSDYFLPRQQQHEVAGLAEAANDKVIDVERSRRKMEAKKNSEMVDRHSVGTSRDLHDPLRSNDNHGSETGSGVGNSCTIQGSFRKDESDKLLPRSKKKSSKVSDNKVEAQCSASRPNIVKASVTTTPDQSNMKEIEKASSALSSSSERVSHKYKSQSNQKSVTTKKASGENSGKNISNHGKSLLAISGSIFKDDNDDSSDDDGFVDSDASTRTPSDDSSSSNYSEVENKTGSSRRTKKMVDGGNSSSLKNMTLNAILKSSNRFKKAKITASQSQYEDTESQPVDIVPDSEANL